MIEHNAIFLVMTVLCLQIRISVIQIVLEIEFILLDNVYAKEII